MTPNMIIVQFNSTQRRQHALRMPARRFRRLLGLCLLLSGLAFAQSGVVSSLDNPLQVALLQWNKQDTPPAFYDTVSNPIGLAFDGANIWVTNFGSNSVMELAANDGSVRNIGPHLEPRSGNRKTTR